MTASHFNKLIDLALENCPESRRALFCGLADLFVETRGARSLAATHLFGDVFAAIAALAEDCELDDLARSAPLDHLNEVFFLVDARLRRRILERNANADGPSLNEALARTGARFRRLACDPGFKPGEDEMRRAHVFISLKRAEGELTGKLLLGLYRDRQHARFLCGLAELAGVETETARVIVARKDVDALAILCRAADFERTHFIGLASLLSGEAASETFAHIYDSVPLEAARRALHFHKMRKSAEERAAA